MKMKPFFAVALGMWAVLGSAADFRVDLQGKSIGLAARDCNEGVLVSQAGWLGDKKDQRLVVVGRGTDEWTKKSVTFTPKSDGKVEICLMSEKPSQWCAYDRLEVSGGSLQNGDLEELDSNGNFRKWRRMGKPRLETENGGHFAVCTHNDRWTQTIDCKKGENVTLRFWVKIVR